MATASPIDWMIDIKRGMISREISSLPISVGDDLEKLSTCAWLFVGHESQVPNLGDFFVSRMG